MRHTLRDILPPRASIPLSIHHKLSATFVVAISIFRTHVAIRMTCKSGRSQHLNLISPIHIFVGVPLQHEKSQIVACISLVLVTHQLLENDPTQTCTTANSVSGHLDRSSL
jgi:hypothetical protein